MKINWKCRVKNKVFWLAVIPALLLLVKAVAAVFGIELNFDELNAQLADIIEAVFLILGILGVVVDPTTAGMSDSERAMTYDKPN